MTSKFYILLLIITSLLGYLEWGGNHQMFLFQAEGEIISKLSTDPVAVLHPFTILPFLGQVILFVSLFKKKPGKIRVYIGMSGLCILLGLMFLIGLISLNYKVILSTMPFLIVTALTIKHFRMNSNS